MFFRGHNRNFGEQNFAHKSKHDKRFSYNEIRENIWKSIQCKAKRTTGHTRGYLFRLHFKVEVTF